MQEFDTITVTFPLMAEYIRSIDKKIGIEISTIAHTDTVTQVAIWKERYDIRKVCGNLYKNREVAFLRSLQIIVIIMTSFYQLWLMSYVEMG